ncbi:E-selectin isoform 2-T2 [Polymixia lowei]
MDFCFGFNQTRGSKSSTSWITLITLFLYSMSCMWTSVESWSYFYSNTTMDWNTTRSWCQTHYTDMVAIQNQEEISHLNSWLPRMPGYYWIGIRKINNVWTWVGTNKPLTREATNWANNEPNNGKSGKIQGKEEDCVEMYIKREREAGKWNDERCGKKKTALCYAAACKIDSCQNGECVETINSFKCECYEGFHGDKCEHVVKCEEEEVTIPAHGSFNCSHKNGDFSFDSLCQYSCEEGYQLNTNKPLKCVASGNWSEQPPTCELVQCEDLSRPARGFMDCSGPLGLSSYQSTCVFSCEEGHVLVGSQSESLQCGASGLWNDSQPYCAAVQCPHLQELQNGVVNCRGDEDMKFSYENSCSFSCAQGYRLLGSSTVTCMSTAEWSEKMPRCEAITCQKPKEEAHLLSQCSLPFNGLRPHSTCSFSCDSGFELQGAPYIQCSEEGEWDTDIPTCKELKCPPPAAPVWGHIRCVAPSSYVASSVPAGAPQPQGSVCTFSCNDGHELQGALSMECTQSGRWNATPASCTVRCPLLDAPVNGGINCSDAELIYSSQCSFTCDQDHSLNGPVVVTCNRHGNWTGGTPVCKASPQPHLSPTAMGLAAGGAASLSGLSLVAWLLKRLRPKGNKFELNSNSDIEEPPQVYKNSIDSLI